LRIGGFEPAHIQQADRLGFMLIREGPPISLQEIWENLMTSASHNNIYIIMKSIMKDEIKDSVDVVYNLLWYLCISDDPLGTHLSDKETKYLLSLDTPMLQSLLGENYNGGGDRASLLYTILSGHSTPAYELTERYDQIKRYQPSMVYNLAFNQYKIIDHTNATYSIYPPYLYLSQQPVSFIETVITNIDPNSCDDAFQHFGIGFNDVTLTMTQDQKFSYLQRELSSYHNVMSRPSGMVRPPSLIGMNRDTIADLLSYYTNMELIETYEPRLLWTSRNELINVICDDVTRGSKWSFSHKYCTNDDTMNIISGDQHGESNKDDIEDPTLSYGTHMNYRCYQTSELDGCFREYDGIFMFRVPDWDPTSQSRADESPLYTSLNVVSNITQNTSLTEGSVSGFDASGRRQPVVIQPLATNIRLNREFSVESIRQLKNMLENAPLAYNVSSLLDKINAGLNILKSARMQTLHFKRQYQAFTPEQRHIVDIYFTWMFMYSMWMRFWKGPGNVWPMAKINVRNPLSRSIAHRSSPVQRDEHVFIQEGVRTLIIELYENDTVLSGWINNLPAIYHDFDGAEATCASYPITQTLNNIALGDLCMGFGADTILKTAYHYIINVLDITIGTVFDGFINRMLPMMLDMEYRVITTQLNSLRTAAMINNGPRFTVLNERLQALRQPLPRQPSFNPSDYQNNVHVE